MKNRKQKLPFYSSLTSFKLLFTFFFQYYLHLLLTSFQYYLVFVAAMPLNAALRLHKQRHLCPER